MNDIFIGIDCDVDKSGVATSENGKLLLDNLSFFDLQDYLISCKSKIKIVVIEAGWLNKSVWHLPQSLSKMGASQAHRVGAETGRRVGQNHATGRLIVEMCVYLGLPYCLQRPTRAKLDSVQFNKMTGYVGRSNQEQRDAAMLIVGMK